MAGMQGRGGSDWPEGWGRSTGRPADRRWFPPEPPESDTSPWHWLLLIPIVLPLAVPLYNRLNPRLFGVPFYYWCQLAFAGLAAVVVSIVHVTTKRR